MGTASEDNLELFKTLHALQYDRMSKLESQENYITTFVTGLSTITILLTKDEIHKGAKSTALCIIFILTNIIAILYIQKTRTYIKMHQARAEAFRINFAKEFQLILETISKPKDKYFNRTNLFSILHALIALVGLLFIFA